MLFVTTMSFICYHCNSSCSKKFNLQRHIIKKHTNNGSDENKKRYTSRILCCKCNNKFNSFSNYHRHLEIHHSVALITTILTFNNISEFQKWKMNIEKETSATFSQTSSAKKRKNGAVLYYFFCHRSFLGKIHKRKTKNKEKSTGSVKIAKSCPAMMKAVIANGTVEVEFCSTHLGHECDIGRLRLSIEDRNLLAEKLSAGVPPRCILADIREKAPPANKDRIHFTKMSDLYNIKKAYGIECPLRYDDDDHISIESWIKEKENLSEADKDQDSDCEKFEKSDCIYFSEIEIISLF